jgi:phosphoglycerate kinase
VKALGGKIGNSICEDDKRISIEILRLAKEKEFKSIPVDVIVR